MLLFGFAGIFAGTFLQMFLLGLLVVAFLLPGGWGWAMAVFPAWWVYFAFQNLDQWPWFVFAIAGGLVYHGMLMMAVQRFFLRVEG